MQQTYFHCIWMIPNISSSHGSSKLNLQICNKIQKYEIEQIDAFKNNKILATIMCVESTEKLIYISIT